MDKFNMTKVPLKTREDHINIKHWDKESLMSFLERFKNAYDEIEDFIDDAIHIYFEDGLKDQHLKFKLHLCPTLSISEIFYHASK